jgi:hypothetical protein
MTIRFFNLLLALMLGVAATGCTVDVAGVQHVGGRTVMSSTVEDPTFALTAPEGSVEASIQEVILRANREQEQAIASRNPEVMRESATEPHYRDMADSNEAMLSSGITAIRLVEIEWGDISFSGIRATATTWETWTTTFRRGESDQSRDRNVYVLIQQDGLWKIQANEHPDAFVPPSGTDVDRPAPGPLDPDLPSAVSRGRSSNWSGYAAVGGTYTGVTGTWTLPEPTVTEGQMGISATWVGIGGEHTRDLIQAGTEETVLSSGRIRYSAWYEILPAPSRPVRLTVSAGDTVTVSVNQDEPGIWSISFINQTTGGRYDRTVAYDSWLSSAEWIVEAPSMTRGGLLPLSDFGTVRFTDGSAIKNGQTVSLAQAGARPITMINRRNEALATPSVLDRLGSGFTVKREDAAPTVGAPTRRRGSD